MAGIGEASAIIGVVQVGFSLATALNTYISDVSDAADDISNLVSDIEATFGQLRDLAKLIEKNVITKAWSEDGLRNAQKCVENCEKVIKKLRKLLKKSTASATTEEVDRDEIDVSKLERALWPFIKPQLEVRRKELQSIKQDIVIAYSSYMTQVGTDAERQKFTDDLPRLQRTRALARKQVLQAKEQRRKYGSARQRRPQPRRSAQGFPDSGIPADDEVLYRAQPYEGAFSDDGNDQFPDEDGPFIYDYFDDLERDFELWKKEEDERKTKEEAQTKRVQEEAIEAWRQQQLQEVETIRKKIEENRSALRAELTKQQIAPQQINDVVNHVYPQEPINTEFRLSNLTPATNSTPSVVSGDGRSSSSNSRRWSIWSKKKSISDQTLSSVTTAVEDTQETPVPKLLRDPTAEGGIARLEASYWQRSEGELPRVQHFAVEIPGQWLLNALIKREEAVAQDSKKVNSVWKEFSQLPSDYRHAIGEHVQEKNDYGAISWVLLHLDCMPGNRRHSILNRNGRGELVGVYVVLKEKRKPKPQSPASRDDEVGYSVREARATGESELIDRRTSSLLRKQSRSGYKPRHNSHGSAASRLALRDNRVTKDYGTEDGDVVIIRRPPEREEEYHPRRSTFESSSDYASNRRRNVSFEREEVDVRSPQRFYSDYDRRYDERSAAPILSNPRRERPRSRSRHRSPSPKPLRRSGTDESYRSSGSATGGRELVARRHGEFEREVIIRRATRDLPQLSRLSDIQERSENASITSSSDESDDGLQQTDKELLEKTMNEYVNRGSGPPKPSVDDELDES